MLHLSAARVAIRYLTAGALTDVSKLRFQAVFVIGAGGSGKGFVGRKWMKYMPGAPSSGLDFDDPRHKELLKRKLSEAERSQSNLDFNTAVADLKKKGIALEVTPEGKGKLPFKVYEYGAHGEEKLIAPEAWKSSLPPKIYDQIEGLRELVFSAPVHEIPSYWRQVNPDIYKEELAGYVAESPGYVHEMSSEMAKSYFAAVLETGDPLFIDGTGSDLEKLRKQILTASNAGYRTSLVFVFVPLTVNQIRNATRARNVAARIITEQWGKISNNFAELRSVVDKAKLIINDNPASDEQLYLKNRDKVESFIRRTSSYASLHDLIAAHSSSELGTWGRVLSGS